MIAESVIQQIHDLDIATVIGGYVALKHKGRYYECCCPFHNEKTPSFKVDSAKGKWYCYGSCQEGGDAIAFVMKYNNCSFYEAVKAIAHNHGITYEEIEQSSEDEAKSRKREAMFSANALAQEFFVKSFNEANQEAKSKTIAIIVRMSIKVISKELMISLSSKVFYF